MKLLQCKNQPSQSSWKETLGWSNHQTLALVQVFILDKYHQKGQLSKRKSIFFTFRFSDGWKSKPVPAHRGHRQGNHKYLPLSLTNRAVDGTCKDIDFNVHNHHTSIMSITWT